MVTVQAGFHAFTQLAGFKEQVRLAFVTCLSRRLVPKWCVPFSEATRV